MDETEILMLESVLELPGSSLRLNLVGEDFTFSYNAQEFSKNPEGYVSRHIQMYDEIHEGLLEELTEISGLLVGLVPADEKMTSELGTLVQKARRDLGDDTITSEQLLRGIGGAAKLIGGVPMWASFFRMIAGDLTDADFTSKKEEGAVYRKASFVFRYGSGFFAARSLESDGLSDVVISKLGYCRKKGLDLSASCMEYANKNDRVVDILKRTQQFLSYIDGSTPTE